MLAPIPARSSSELSRVETESGILMKSQFQRSGHSGTQTNQQTRIEYSIIRIGCCFFWNRTNFRYLSCLLQFLDPARVTLPAL